MERTIIGAERSGKRKIPHYKLTAVQLEQVRVGVDDALSSLGLSRSETFQPSRSWFDGLAVEDNTKKADGKQLRGLMYFWV